MMESGMKRDILKYATISNANKIKITNINEKNMQLIWVQLSFLKL